MLWLRLVLICSMGLVLSSCAHFPQIHPFLLSVKNGVCGEYSVDQKDACHITYTFVKWHPIQDCEGFYLLPPSDIAAIKEWQAKKCANNNQSVKCVEPTLINMQ
jgi:hypothetical protein